MFEKLKAETDRIGEPRWRPMLRYVAQLHERSVHPAQYPFPLPWEEIGPGYCYGPAFGHWDIVHQILDVLPSEPEHALNQVINNLRNQCEDGLVPGSIWMKGDEPHWSKAGGHPPVWPFAVQDHCELTGSWELATQCLDPLIRQIEWFEKSRKADEEGYYYLDILNKTWESGVDEGVRFDDVRTGPYACVDATAHVDLLYQFAAEWCRVLGKEGARFESRHEQLADFIQTRLWDEESGFFHDVWAVGNPVERRLTFEGMWPVVTRAATQEQAQTVIDGTLLNPERLFTQHPIATVAVSDPAFDLRMWRGPAWNSMTYWAARGCARWGRGDAARAILERALDSSAKWFENTGTIWEFYHPLDGDPRELARKPHTSNNTPCSDYLGHNPLIAMARLWEKLG